MIEVCPLCGEDCGCRGRGMVCFCPVCRPKQGRPVTTQRGRTAGGREARCWLSAAEYSEIERLAEARGVTVSGLVRCLLLDVVGQQ